MLKQQILRKELSREVKDGKETIINEHIQKEILQLGDFQFIYNHFENLEPEEIYLAGVSFTDDSFDDIYHINISEFLTYCDTYLKDNEDDKDDSPDYTFILALKEHLTQYKDYNLWC